MKKCIRYCLIVCAFSIHIAGNLFYSPTVLLCSCLMMLSGNIFYCFEKIKDRMLFLIFNIVTGVFLMGRPFVGMINNTKWWTFSQESTKFALRSIFLTLVFLLVGAMVTEILINKRESTKKKNSIFESTYYTDFLKSLQFVSLILFYVTLAICFVVSIEKLLFMRGRLYVDLYTDFKSVLPHAIISAADMMPYALCMYLATFPNKTKAFLPLALYVVSALPDLLIGLRNPIVQNCIFVFVYYFIRDIYNDKKKWIGRCEKVFIIAVAPVALLFLAAYNYIRDGVSVSKSVVSSLFLDFIYHQGVTFDVLCIGYDCIPKLPVRAFRNYTFGGFIDYFKFGPIGQVLLGTEALPGGNNLRMALESNSFSHNMSYIAKGQEYLAGHGWGSSYILETFTDFGYIGIILFSIALGAFLIFSIKSIKKNWFLTTFILVALTSIYFVPRAASTDWLSFIITIQFWVPTIFCYFVSKLCTKSYSYNLTNINKKSVF